LVRRIAQGAVDSDNYKIRSRVRKRLRDTARPAIVPDDVALELPRDTSDPDQPGVLRWWETIHADELQIARGGQSYLQLLMNSSDSNTPTAEADRAAGNHAAIARQRPRSAEQPAGPARITPREWYWWFLRCDFLFMTQIFTGSLWSARAMYAGAD